MKALFGTPSPHSGPVRLADHTELLALKSSSRKASAAELIAAFDRRDDEDEDRFERPAEEAFEELDKRVSHLGEFAHRYPFSIKGDVLELRPNSLKKDADWLYLYLLLATESNMRDDRKHAGLDGAEIFEALSAEVGLRYFGRPKDNRTGKRVFGTSRINWPADESEEVDDLGVFGQAVNQLCADLGEGGAFSPKADERITARDDKLDVVVWKNFADKRASKLIAFGQCKTGTRWNKELPRLVPDTFCRRWFRDQPCFAPLKMFFVTDRVAGKLTHKGYEAGILFDRCRVLDYAHDLPSQLTKDCAKWARAVLAKHKIKLDRR